MYKSYVTLFSIILINIKPEGKNKSWLVILISTNSRFQLVNLSYPQSVQVILYFLEDSLNSRSYGVGLLEFMREMESQVMGISLFSVHSPWLGLNTG